MSNPVGNVVSRLIRQRSYAAGELKALDKQLAKAEEAIHAAKAAHRALMGERRAIVKGIAALDSEIAEQSRVQIAEIAAVKATPKRIKCRWGSINSEFVALLKSAGGPISTSEIIAHMVAKFGLPVGTASERRMTRRWATAKLQVLVRRGAIVRLHDPTDNRIGVWLWVGL